MWTSPNWGWFVIVCSVLALWMFIGGQHLHLIH